jgi:hypothetical protein
LGQDVRSRDCCFLRGEFGDVDARLRPLTSRLVASAIVRSLGFERRVLTDNDDASV